MKPERSNSRPREEPRARSKELSEEHGVHAIDSKRGPSRGMVCVLRLRHFGQPGVAQEGTRSST
jgi:hypothetical protein